MHKNVSSYTHIRVCTCLLRKLDATWSCGKGFLQILLNSRANRKAKNERKDKWRGFVDERNERNLFQFSLEEEGLRKSQESSAWFSWSSLRVWYTRISIGRAKCRMLVNANELGTLRGRREAVKGKRAEKEDKDKKENEVEEGGWRKRIRMKEGSGVLEQEDLKPRKKRWKRNEDEEEMKNERVIKREYSLGNIWYINVLQILLN